ncbi:MAG: CPXCG motif-containing cysteine-rich protein [Acidobacteriota bacterium]|nr:hypothetical protein [Acidobacteriota bacterium]MEC7769391.1 CPXCG motif-containing cysteine-rich protein [Acidobacteriota bacterium]
MENRTIACPYCGQQLDVLVDPSIPRQEYVEDCQVCCRPITLQVTVDRAQNIHVFACTDSE